MIKFIKNLGSKFLIIVIALSFAVWGIGDIFISNQSNPTIAKVSNSNIKLNEFKFDYQLLVDRLRQSSDQPITEDFLKALGIHSSVLDSLITKKYINFLSSSLQINIADKYVKKAIINNPMFNDQLGLFNKDYFNYYLNRNGLKEKDIYNITKDAISNDLVMQSITHSEFVPSKIANNLIKKRDTVRKANIFTFDTSSMIISDRNFTDDVIIQKYEKVKNNFKTPETRNIKVASFIYGSSKNAVNVTEEEMKNFYDKNISLYQKEESRDIFIVQFKEIEKIQQFLSDFNKNQNIIDALKNFNKNKENSFLENVKKEDLDPESGQIVFNLKLNEISEIVKTSFGYKVFYLKDIRPESTSSFEENKEKIKIDLINEKSSEKIYNSANTFYEKFLETRNFKQSLENLKVEVNKYEDLGINNLIKAEELKSMGLDENQLSILIFNLKKNDISEVIEDKDNNLHYVYLEKINSSKQKPLQEVKSEVINLMYEEVRDSKSKEIAQEFRKIYAGKKYDGKFKNNFFNSKTSDWITLDDRLGKDMSYQIKESIFSNKLNAISEIIFIEKSKYVLVIPIEQSQKILLEDQRNKIDSVILELNNSIELDLNNAIISDLSKLYKSNVNEKFLDSF